MSFRVDLDVFQGPLDLLVYLVRKHEVDPTEVAVGPIAEQYLELVETLGQIDVDAAAEFLELAGLLLEIKSRQVLPHAGEEADAIEEDRQDLIRQLLEYKRFRDAAGLLDERARAWQERFPRRPGGDRAAEIDPREQPIHEVELWDLVSALGRVMRSQSRGPATSIVYDDTPIEVYMARIQQRLAAEGRLSMSGLFAPGMHKSSLVSIFLALLELIRHHDVRCEQEGLFGEIWIRPAEPRADAAAVDAPVPAGPEAASEGA